MTDYKDNGKWAHLVEYLFDLYDRFSNSAYRKKLKELISESVDAYNQEEKPSEDPWPGAQCFHKDVEILTESGWKPVRDVAVGEEVLSRAPKTGVLSYERVSNVFESNSNDLIRIKNLFFDIQVTHNHKFPLEQQSKDPKRHFFKWVTAKNILEGFINDQRWKLPLTGKWISEEVETLWGFDPNDFMEFLGWFISEGWSFKTGRSVAISQSVAANPEKCERISKLLDRMGLDYSYNRQTSSFLIKVNSSLYEHLSLIGKGASSKFIPRFYFNLPQEQLKVLFESMVAGDGCISWAKDKHRNHPKITYYTVSKRLADDFQELCQKIGYSASITNNGIGNGGIIRGRQITGKNVNYCISVRFTEFSRFRRDRCSVEVVPYNDRVYCVEVPPHNTVYVRQNGRPLWSGNSTMLPLTTISADNMEPRLVAGLVGKQPYVRFDAEEPRPEEIDELEGWFSEELRDTVSIEDTAGQLVHRLLQDGTVFPMCSYDLDEVVRKDFLIQGQEPAEMQQALAGYQQQMMQAQQMAQTTGQMETPPPPKELMPMMQAQVMGGVYIGPDGEPMTYDRIDRIFEGGNVELLKWEDVYWPDNVDDWEKAPVIRKVMYTYAELQRLKGKPGWIDDAINEDLLRYESKDAGGEEPSAQQESDGVKVTGKEEIECLECYVSYIYQEENQDKADIKDWTEQRLVATVAKDCRKLLRILPLREVNFKNEHIIKRISIFRERGKTCGVPIYGKIKSIQKAANSAFNTAFNIADIVLLPWFFYKSSTQWKNTGEVKLKPGMGIPVDDTAGILIPQFGINPAQYFQYLEICLSFWERVLSVGDLQVGRTDDKKTTATEVLAAIQEGNIVHNYRAQGLRPEFLSMLQTLYDLYYQHMPLDKVWVHGGKEIQITRALMQRGKSFRLTATTESANKMIERREKEGMWQLAISDPFGISNPVEIFTEMIKSYGHEDPDRFTNPVVNKVVKVLKQFPEAAQVFDMAMQQVMAQAAQLKTNADQAGAALTMGGMPNAGPEGVPGNGGIQGLPPQAGGGNSGLLA